MRAARHQKRKPMGFGQIPIHLRRQIVIVEANALVIGQIVTRNTGKIRLGQSFLKELRSRTQPASRNHIGGKLRARTIHARRTIRRERIEDARTQFTEIAGAHARGRQCHKLRVGGYAVLISVVRPEKEQLVTLNRSAKSEAVLILILLRPSGRKETTGIELSISEILVKRSVKLIRPRLHRVILRALPVKLY